jgi:hypothetical protein
MHIQINDIEVSSATHRIGPQDDDNAGVEPTASVACWSTNLSTMMISSSASSKPVNSRSLDVGSNSVVPRIGMWVLLDEGNCCSHVTASASIGVLSECSPEFLTPEPLASRSPAGLGFDVDRLTGTLLQARLWVVLAGRSGFQIHGDSYSTPCRMLVQVSKIIPSQDTQHSCLGPKVRALNHLSLRQHIFHSFCGATHRYGTQTE